MTRARSGGLSPSERDELTHQCLPLVKRLAGRLAGRLPAHVDVQDLIQAGLLGLLDALDKFDRERGVRFWTYAEVRIRGAMLDSLRGLDWVPRSVRRRRRQIEQAFTKLEATLRRPATDQELAKELGVEVSSLGKILDEVRGPEIGLVAVEDLEDSAKFVVNGEESDPFVLVEKRELRQHLTTAVEALPERERLVITLYYHEELTMKEVGEVLGVNESRISQIHSKAVLRLRSHLARILEAGASTPATIGRGRTAKASRTGSEEVVDKLSLSKRRRVERGVK